MRMLRSFGVAVVALAALLSTQRPVSSLQGPTTEWPRWRGAAFDGKATTAGNLLSRPFELHVKWKRSLGAGYSGIAVAGGRAVTLFSDGTRDFLAALDADSGADAWRIPVGAAFPGRDGSAGGPVSTPTIADGVVYGLGPHGLLVAAALNDGRVLWKRDLVAELGATEPHWGFTTSPLATGNLVVVLTGGTSNNAITALDRKTGATVWQTGTDLASYQSPMLARIGGEERIVVGGDQYLFALEPRTGREVWRYEHGGRGFYAKIINPVAVGADGLFMTYRPDESILLKTSGTPAVAWATRDVKLNYATPVTHNGLVFGYSGTFLACVDAATGASKWRSRQPGDGFPIVVDDHLVVLTKTGKISVAEASGGGFVERASADVFSKLVWTPPSFANGRVYARDSYDEIAAVEIVPRRSTTEASAAPAAGTLPDSEFGRWVADVERSADGSAMVDAWMRAQTSFPVIEGDSTAHIVYRGEASDLVIAGDMLETGRPIPMHRVTGTDLYYASFTLAPDARVAYQFIRNLDQTIADPKNPRKATSLNYAGDASLLVMPRAAAPSVPAAVRRGSVVDLEITNAPVSSNQLNWGGKRKLHVYLPPGYDADPSRRYPAVYVLYGQQMLEDGHLDLALEQAFGKRMPPMIAVFVESTNAYEYARTFRDVHIRMLEKDVVPLVDGKFRTVAAPAQRILLGADEAGFGALEATLRLPGVFGNAVAHSIFPLSKGDEELLELIDRTPKTGQRFYVDWGRYDPHRRADLLDVPGISRKVRDRLAARGFDVSGGESGDGSTVPFWIERAIRGLEAVTAPAAGDRQPGRQSR